MERERLTRYHQAITKWKNECNVIDREGVLCGDKPWDMAVRKVKSLIYLSLGVEGREKHGRKFPHTNVETKTTIEIWEELETTSIRPRNVTFDRYLLLTRRQHRGETMEQFHSALRSLAEHCQLGHLKDELLRDIFTTNMIDPEIQKELDKGIGQEDLISDERWEQSDLDSDREVKEAKAKKLREAKEDSRDIPRVIKMESSEFEEPLAKTSPRLLLAKKNIATTRSKKNLQGLYEAVPEGTVFVKTTDATLTLYKRTRSLINRMLQSSVPPNKEIYSEKDRKKPPQEKYNCSEKDRKKPPQKDRGIYAEPSKGPYEQDHGNSNHS